MDVAPTDEQLAAVLDAVERHGEPEVLLDSGELARLLGLPADEAARQVAAATARRLLWCTKSGGPKTPHFSDIELTVQGRRFLAARAPRS